MGGSRVISVKHNCPQIRDKAKRIRELIDGGWQREAVAHMRRAQHMARRLTPVSKGPGPHLRDGWTMKVIGRGGKDRVPVLCVVHNKRTHNATGRAKPGALLRDARGRRRSFTLLDVLEYGSRAHHIRPVRAKCRRWPRLQTGV